MKKTIVASCVALFLASQSLSQAQTQSTLAQWTFENLAITNYSPNPAPSLDKSAGAVSVSELGMTNWPTTGYGTNDPDVLQGKTGDSSTFASGGDGITNTTKEWRVRATGAGNGWSSQAPVGTQGAQFNVDTTGFGNIQVGFDWYLTAQGEANLQLEYTVDGTNWSNVPITIPAGQAGTYLTFVDNTSDSDTNSVDGYYVHSVAYTGGQQWFTNLTASITNPAAANNPNFAVRLVNASTGLSCVSGTGAALNNSSGNWRFDNINITGAALPGPIVDWNFENVPQVTTLDPAPFLNNSAGAVSAACIGMQLFGGGTTNAPDVTQGASGDTGSDGITNYTQIWRVRGVPGNGWTSTAAVGSQGAQFGVDTTGYTNIEVAFDWYLTKQGEANIQLQYTVDGVTWLNYPITVPAAQLGTYATFVDNTSGSDSDSVQGYYISSVANSGGQQWFTNLTAVITNPAAANNPNFAIRLVNASTGDSCLNGTGTALNNTSGNWRFDNIVISGNTTGATLTPPSITPSPVANVDGSFTNTFTDNANWRESISAISIGGVALPSSAYVISAGQIVFNPSASSLLETAGTVTFSINATNYSVDLVSQYIASGAAKRLVLTSQPAGPTGNGGTLVLQPTLAFYDQYNNVATNGTATYTASPSAGWSFGAGSSPTQMLTSGTVSFTNLSAISADAVSDATITFTASGTSGLSGVPYTTTNSIAFNIPAPATTGFTPGNLVVEQEDLVTKNSTFSMLELNPAIVNQTPVNVFPVPATGTNGLRQSSSGSAGRLADSDDGTLLCFSAGLCSDATVSDVTTVDPRGAGTFNAQANYNVPATYIGLGDSTANQARSAVTVDDATYYMGDKGGVYTNDNNPNDAYLGYTTGNQANVRSLKSFGGTIYALQQYGGTDPTASVLSILPQPPSDFDGLFQLAGFPIDGSVLDFYMVASGANGTNFDTVYYIDGTNNTSGAIFKFYFTFTTNDLYQPVWAPAGSWPTPDGGDGLCAAVNPQGGVDLYYTTGSGGTAGNSVIHVHDSAAWDQAIDLTETNVVYAGSAESSLRGIAFAPVAPPGAPTVATLAASPVTATAATLNGSVSANGQTTTYWFQYGLTTAYGSFSATNSLAAGSAPQTVSALLAGLAPGTLYHYQIVAANSLGTVPGADMTFSTVASTSLTLTGLHYSSGSFVLGFTAPTGSSFSILATNNLAAPISTWPVLGSATESPAGSGNYVYTNSTATNGQQFYILRQP